MRAIIAPYIAQFILSLGRLERRRNAFEKKRRRQGHSHVVTVFLRINDPYSYLLLQALPDLKRRFDVDFEFRTVLDLPADMYPAPQLWYQNALQDARFLADLYADVVTERISFPASPPTQSEHLDQVCTAQLLHWELQPGYLGNALKLFQAYWENPSKVKKLVIPAVADHAECYRHHLAANQDLLDEQGHYMSGMLGYGGEWYWGLDRLQHLESRLLSVNAAKQNTQALFTRTRDRFCQHISDEVLRKYKSGQKSKPTITMYFSSRSPYSYLGLARVKELAEHYGCQLIIKPVLPMVMRRMQVPKQKGQYITLDVAREAREYGIPFGRIADPLGAGVERTYALFSWAEAQSKGTELLLSVARGNWAEGIRSDTDSGLRKLVERTGLNWAEAKQHLNNDEWRVRAQENLAELYSLDQWGVPSFRVKETTVFGQDRLEQIEQLLAGD